MAEQTFNPGEYLTSIQGRAYLGVAGRKKWLQDLTKTSMERAHAYTLVTDAHHINAQVAVFKATLTIYDDNGMVVRSTTGYGSETPDGFPDYIEKAETKAVGRALGNAGFATDNVDDEDVGLIVDAPRGTASPGGSVRSFPSRGGDEGPTNAQWGLYQQRCRERNVTPQERSAFTKRSISTEIDRLGATAPAQAAPPSGMPEPDEPSW